MTSPETASIHDDARDAIALIRACLDEDIDAAEVIHHNCDLAGVVHIMAGLLAQSLTDLMGETGARKWLAHMQRQAS